MQGYVHVYTGDGKGKTTAALGLAVRAALSGMRVLIGQFMKGTDYAELGLRDIAFPSGSIEIVQYGTGRFICQGESAGEEDLAAARRGIEDLVARIGSYDLVVADEICVAVHLGLLAVDDVLGLVDARPGHVELVLTGRRAPRAIVDRADLVTEMREVKHYYAGGVKARKGIEY